MKAPREVIRRAGWGAAARRIRERVVEDPSGCLLWQGAGARAGKPQLRVVVEGYRWTESVRFIVWWVLRGEPVEGVPIRVGGECVGGECVRAGHLVQSRYPARDRRRRLLAGDVVGILVEARSGTRVDWIAEHWGISKARANKIIQRRAFRLPGEVDFLGSDVDPARGYLCSTCGEPGHNRLGCPEGGGGGHDGTICSVCLRE